MNTLFSYIKTHQVMLLFMGAVLTVLIFIAIMVVSFFETTRPQQSNEADPASPVSGTTVKDGYSISPDTATPLQPGSKQSFILVLPTAVKDEKISIIREDFTKDVPEEPAAFTQSKNQRTYRLFLTNPILPYSSYTVTVSSGATALFSATYVSDIPKAPPAEKNNNALVPFLPHETSTYKLSFDEAENRYIFNFIYNDTSSLTLDTQYENAKNAALEFIRSKNIDPNTLVIDWRFS